MRAIRREKRDDLPDKKRAADGDVMRDMLRSITGDDLRAYRDRALLAIGMAGAFRRSELVEVTVARVAEDARGLLIRILPPRPIRRAMAKPWPFWMVAGSNLSTIIMHGLKRRGFAAVRCSASSRRRVVSLKSR
ncbi:hypothetical protein GCM10020258_50810 [Sphingomonas yabuuchiae]